MSIQHQTMVKAMSKDGAKIKEDLTAQDAELLHASVGISGEVGGTFRCYQTCNHLPQTY